MKKNLSIVCATLMALGSVLNVYATENQSAGIMKASFMKEAKKKTADEKKEQAERGIQQELEMEINTIRFLKFKAKIGEIFVPNSSVADVEMIDDKSLYLSGLAPGTTFLTIHDKQGRILADYQIKVTYPLKEIKASIAKVYPDTEIELLSVQDNVVLKGRVSSPEKASDVAEIVSRFVDKEKVINKLTIETATQVMLKVKVAEVSRTVSKELGVNWRALSMGSGAGSAMIGFTHNNGATKFPEFLNGGEAAKTAFFEDGGTLGLVTNGGGRWLVSAGMNNLAALIDALASESMAYVLAEPALVALSGKSATFKSGGEEPYTVRQDGQDSNTTEFKDWGTSLEFTPVVLSEDRINIKVKAEVSTLSKAQSSDGTPALVTKNVETVVELGSGQSLALAGLVQTSKDTKSSETPLLADIPFLGSLFRSSKVSVDEKELVIIVTPYVVKPSSKKLSTPMDSAPKLNSPLDSIVDRSFCSNSGFLLR